MKQIELYVDSVYRNIGGNKKDTQELKAEMKGHLLEAVRDLQSEGKTEQEAVEIAIQRFGEEKEMRSIVEQLFNAQRMFSKWLLVVSLAFLIMCGTVFSTVAIKESKMVSVENSVRNQVTHMLEKEGTIKPYMEEELRTLIMYKDNIKSVKITDSNGAKSAGYDKHVTGPEWLYSYYHNIETVGKWSVETEISRFKDYVFIGSLAGLVVYWTLFTIWAVINSYHHKRLNITWIIVFALFNVFGYLVYNLVGKNNYFDQIA